MQDFYNFIPIYRGGKNIFGRLLNSTEASLTRYASRMEAKNKELSDLVKELAASKKDPKKIFSDDKYDKLRKLLKKGEYKAGTSTATTGTASVTDKAKEKVKETTDKAKSAVSGAVDAASERVKKGKNFLVKNKNWLIPTGLVAGSGTGRWAIDKVLNIYNWSPDGSNSSDQKFITINGVKTPIISSDGINFTVSNQPQNNADSNTTTDNGVSDAAINDAYNQANAEASSSTPNVNANATAPIQLGDAQSQKLINDLFDQTQW